MKKNKILTFRNILMSALLILIVGLFSCTDSGTSTTSSNTDSNRTQDNTMTGANGANGNTNAQNSNHMNDGSGISGSTSDGAGTTGSNNNGSDNNSNNSISSDTSFMLKAAEINMEEIKLGKLALQKGTSSHVKELAKMMVAEHTQAMKGLTPLAKTKMVTLPVKETSKITDAFKTLNSKSGKEFDKAYSDMMVDGHKDAISLFEKTNNNTKDAEIKAMTTAMLPKLKTHLEHAEMCKKECEKM